MGLSMARSRAGEQVRADAPVDPELPVIRSYRPWRGLRLHSLARLCTYRCARCDLVRDSTVAATVDDDPTAIVCPWCFGAAAEHPGAPAEVPEQSGPREPQRVPQA